MANVAERNPHDLWIHELIRDKVAVAEFLHRYRIVSAPQCPDSNCAAPCIPERIISERELSRNRLPFRWRCSNPYCHQSLPFLHGSYLENTKLPLGKHILLIYKYYLGRNAKETSKELRIAHSTAKMWFSYFRRCASHYMQNDFYPSFQFNIQYAIQWDEAAFAKKQKHHRGNVGAIGRRQPKWVLGGVQQETGFVALKYVQRRDAANLQAFISAVSPIGATIITDSWGGYLGLDLLGYLHWNVNHEEGFVNPLTGYHTNCIEGLWMLVRSNLRKYKGIKAEHLQTFLDEFAFRRNMNLHRRGLWVNLLLMIGVKQRVITRP